MLAGVKINIFNAANDIKIESIRLKESIIHNSIYKRVLQKMTDFFLASKEVV